MNPAETRTAIAAEPEPTREERFAAWVEKHRKAIGIGAGALALVVAVTWFMSIASARRERFAQAGLDQAWMLADQGNLPQAAVELQRIIQGFGGTEAALEARLSLNQNRIQSGQHQLAVDDLRAFLATSPPAHARLSANMLLGVALENLNRPGEAASAYAAAAGVAALDYQKADALVAAARAQRTAGQVEEAVGLLRSVVERYPGTAGASVAQVRLGELLRGGAL